MPGCPSLALDGLTVAPVNTTYKKSLNPFVQNAIFRLVLQPFNLLSVSYTHLDVYKRQVLIAMLLLIPVLMAYWFAPLLVRLHDLTALEAMKMSFMAVFRNIVPVILYAFIFIALTVLAVIPFGLGLLVVVPVMITSTYTSYLDIFNIKQD